MIKGLYGAKLGCEVGDFAQQRGYMVRSWGAKVGDFAQQSSHSKSNFKTEMVLDTNSLLFL